MVTNAAWILSDLNLILGSCGLYLYWYMGKGKGSLWFGLACMTCPGQKKECKIPTLKAKGFDQVYTHFYGFFPPQKLPWGK